MERKRNPLVRVLLSVLLLGMMFYFARQQQSVKAPVKTLPAGSTSEEAASAFRWVPRYPGAEISNIQTKRTADQITYGFQFDVKGDFAPVLAYYENALKTSGFQVTRKGGGEFGASLHGEGAGGRRSIDVAAGKAQQISEIDVIAVMRNEF